LAGCGGLSAVYGHKAVEVAVFRLADLEGLIRLAVFLSLFAIAPQGIVA
jgi:hypothetical protein